MGLRGVQILFSIIVLGLTAYRTSCPALILHASANHVAVVDAYVSWVPGSVAFMLFSSIWTLLAVAYLVLAPARFPAAAHKYAIAGVEFVTMIFWFAAFVAVASLWGDSWWVGHGTFWSCGVAAIVFGAFLWYVSHVGVLDDSRLTCLGPLLSLQPFLLRCTSAARPGTTLRLPWPTSKQRPTAICTNGAPPQRPDCWSNRI